MFLLDTNVGLELLLEQEKTDQVRRLLEVEESSRFALTDFSLRSVGVVLTRLKKEVLFLDFLSHTMEDSAVRVVRLGAAELKGVPSVCRRFDSTSTMPTNTWPHRKYDLTLVSFDSDFDRTERGRRAPAEVTSSLP